MCISMYMYTPYMYIQIFHFQLSNPQVYTTLMKREEQTDPLITETHNSFEQLWVYKQSCFSISKRFLFSIHKRL